MKLVDNWDQVLKKAWSARLALISAALSALEFGLPYIAPVQPNGKFALLAAFISLAAGISRIVAQPGLFNGLRTSTDTTQSPTPDTQQAQ